MSLRDNILSAKDNRLEPVEVPEWGSTVYVPVLTLGDREEIKRLSNSEDNAVMSAIFAIRDADGNRVFTEADAPALQQKSLRVINRVVGVFLSVNGLNEDAGKNSPTTPASGSS